MELDHHSDFLTLMSITRPCFSSNIIINLLHFSMLSINEFIMTRLFYWFMSRACMWSWNQSSPNSKIAKYITLLWDSILCKRQLWATFLCPNKIFIYLTCSYFTWWPIKHLVQQRRPSIWQEEEIFGYSSPKGVNQGSTVSKKIHLNPK